jgi:hypothetical protein
MLGISGIAAQLAASQKGLSSMKLVSLGTIFCPLSFASLLYVQTIQVNVVKDMPTYTAYFDSSYSYMERNMLYTMGQIHFYFVSMETEREQ